MSCPEMIRTWIETNEAYWSQFIWTPYHPNTIMQLDSSPMIPDEAECDT
jgi:hypothetical protein